jgi:cytochrome c oxidase subunit 2
MKMDAVPGIPTTLWFTPKYTTEEMKVRTGNANFVYEISCDQICGKSHFSMRGEIVVERQQEFDQWLATQTPEYTKTLPANNPTAPKTDTTAAGSKPIAVLEAK